MYNYKVSAKVNEVNEKGKQKIIMANFEDSPVLLEREIIAKIQKMFPRYKIADADVDYCCYQKKRYRRKYC